VLTLGIETSTSRAGVALFHPDWSFETAWPAGRGRLELGTQALETLFRWAGVRPGDLGLVAVDLGPGSFTGLRVGMALAKGIAQSMAVPLVGVSQVEVLAEPVKWWNGRLVVWIHDRRDEVFSAHRLGGTFEAPRALVWTDALRQIRQPEETLLVGTGAVKWAQELRELLPDLHLGGPSLAHPRALEVARLGLAKYQQRGPDDALMMEPVYVHKEA